MTVVSARGLTREFTLRRGWRRHAPTVRAVDGITLDISPGESVGYIGANGAGKSTTIKMLCGILVPSSGTVRTCGLDPVPQRRRLARRIGVVFGQRSQLWWDLPLAESLTILAAVHRLPAGWTARRDQLVDRLDLAPFLQRPVRQLSLGERMRGEIAAALLHSPELLVLDEPTVGLDVLSKERLRVFLREENLAHGRTMLLTTHDMDDVERLCDRLLVVDRGRLVFDGSPAQLIARVGADRVLVVDLATPVDSLHEVVGAGATVLAVEGGGLRHRVAVHPERSTVAAVLNRISAAHDVRDLSVTEPDIEDVVRRLYESAGDPDPAPGP